MSELQTGLVLAFVFGIPTLFAFIAIAMSGRCAREEREQQMLRSAEVVRFPLPRRKA
jgi:hypothetical protein